MSESSPGEVTQLLKKWSHGDQECLDKLVHLVYAELRRLSHHYLSRQPANHTFQTSALINEAFVRLIDQEGINWINRAHFFGIAAKTMRNILVDYARQQQTEKRGRSKRAVPFDETKVIVNQQKGPDLLALDDALNSLSAIDPDLSRLVELKFFGGLTIRETAEVLGVSPATVKRGWTTAKIMVTP